MDSPETDKILIEELYLQNPEIKLKDEKEERRKHLTLVDHLNNQKK